MHSAHPEAALDGIFHVQKSGGKAAFTV